MGQLGALLAALLLSLSIIVALQAATREVERTLTAFEREITREREQLEAFVQY